MSENKIISPSILKLLDDFYDWYISKSTFDNPVNDVAHIIAIFLTAKKNKGYEIVLPEFPDRGDSNFIDYISDYAFKACPTLRRNEWRYLFKQILLKKYKGEKIYIKRDPAAEYKRAAKSMTGSELMNKFGISRGYAYKLRAAALKRKQ